MRNRLLATIAVAALVAATFAVPSVWAGEPGDPSKVNDSLEPGPGVTDMAIAPDGETIVYLATQETLGKPELFAGDTLGGPTRRLSHSLPADGEVYDFKITPDGSRVIYRAQGTSITSTDLWSVPIGGGTATELTGTVVSDGAVAEYEITPDGSHVVWLADALSDDDFELFSAPVSGAGSPERLNNPLGTDDDVLEGDGDNPEFKISPDSSRVVFRVYDQSADSFELYAANVNGSGSATIISDAGGADDNVDGDYHILADSTTVVYLADQDMDQKFELYATPITSGGSSTKLSGSIQNDADVIDGMQVSADGQYVVYRVFDDSSGVFALFSTRTNGSGGPNPLNGPLVAGGDVDGSFLITPNSQRVVYISDEDVNDKFELFSVPIGGGSQARLSGTSPDTADVLDTELGGTLVVTPNSSRVLFESSRGGSGAFDLWSAPVGGGTPVQLNGAIAAGGVLAADVTPDSGQVIYIADQDAPVQFEIFRVPVDGGPFEKLNGPLATDGDVQNFAISPESSAVAYRADEDTNDVVELFSVTLGISCNGRLATIIGTDGDDVINGTSGPDVIVGLAGNDVINGNGGRDTICGNSGRDTINGGTAGDTIFGGSGRDTIRGNTGNDVIEGGSAADDIEGNGGRDTLRGGTGADTISGGPKADVIEGNGGRDTIRGGKGGDTISGGPKADNIWGNSGRDTIRGNKGPDRIRGGSGADDCDGGSGADVLTSC